MREPRSLECSPSDGSDEFDFIFSNYFKNKMSFPTQAGWKPAIDLFDTDDEVVVVVDIAGVDRKSIKLTVERSVLRIRGERDDVHAHVHRNYHIMEIAYGHFERSVELPDRIDPDHIDAKYEEGLLFIRMNKRPPEAERTINIGGGF